MCGIFFYYGTSLEKDYLEELFNKIKHRGPDNSQILTLKNLFFGFHRLSINGLDEISIADETFVAEFKDGNIIEYTIKPEDFFNVRQSLDGLSVSDAEQSFDIISDALGKQQGESAGKAADLIAINAGAALYVSGCAANLTQGVAMAQDAIVSGLAKAKISDFAAFTRAQADS